MALFATTSQSCSNQRRANKLRAFHAVAATGLGLPSYYLFDRDKETPHPLCPELWARVEGRIHSRAFVAAGRTPSHHPLFFRAESTATGAIASRHRPWVWMLVCGTTYRHLFLVHLFLLSFVRASMCRQVLLVQLAERSAGADGAPSQQAPSARCLRHLVAMSKGGDGDPESIYSFAEVRLRPPVFSRGSVFSANLLGSLSVCLLPGSVAFAGAQPAITQLAGVLLLLLLFFCAWISRRVQMESLGSPQERGFTNISPKVQNMT